MKNVTVISVGVFRVSWHLYGRKDLGFFTGLLLTHLRNQKSMAKGNKASDGKMVAFQMI